MIKLKVFVVDEDWVQIFIPMIWAGIPLLIWLRPRLKLLRVKTTGKGDPVFGCLMLTLMTVVASTYIAQKYIDSATGKLTQLDNIIQIRDLPETKYYSVKHFFINKKLAHIKPFFWVSGKYKGDFNIRFFDAVPVFDHLFPDTTKIADIIKRADPNVLVIINSKLGTMQYLKKLPADSISRMRYINPSLVMPKYGEAGKYGAIAVLTRAYKVKSPLPVIKIAPIVWLGIEYNKTISNSLSLAEKNLQFKVFAMECSNNFMHIPLDKFTYLSRLANNKELRGYIAAVKSRDDVVDGEPIILKPVFEPFANRNGDKLFGILLALSIGSSIFLLIISFIPLKEFVDVELYQRNSEGN